MKLRNGLIVLLILTLTGCGSVMETPAQSIEMSEPSELPETKPENEPESETETSSDAQNNRLYVVGEFDNETQTYILGWWFADNPVAENFRILMDGDLLAVLNGEEFWNEEDAMFEYMQEYFTPEQEAYVFTIESSASSAEITLSKNENGLYVFEEKDSDGDGLADWEELWEGTDPENPDTDGDGLPDGYEYENGSDLDPLLPDTDGNGIPDGEEDYDADGLTELEEYQFGTNRYAYDTDDDGFSDGYEVKNGMNPLEYNEIVVDSTVIDGLMDYKTEDIEVLNLDAYYPLVINFNDELTQVTSIMGVYSEVTVQTPVDAIYALYNVKSLLGLETPEQELRIVRVNDDRDIGNVYCFAQYYNGLKVLGRTVNVSVDAEGKTNSLSSSALPTDSFRELNLIPDITEDRVVEMIATETGTENYTALDLAIYTHDDLLKLVYWIKANYGTMIVDAHSGEIILPWQSSMIID